MLGLKVKKEKGEEVRQKLLDKGLLNLNYKIKTLGDHIVFPLSGKVDFGFGEIVKTEFEPQEKRETIEEKLRDELTQEELGLLPSSYDVIGDILVLELDEELVNKEEEIGKAFLDKFKNVNVVVRKKGPVKGELRIQKVEVIAGENRTETLHKENNCKFKVDINEVFYTPRMARERKLISDKVKNGEKIVDLFAGVGPYSIPIAKNNEVEVIAIEKNEVAYEYFKENIKLNGVEKRIKAYLGDCRKVVDEEEIENTADRILMNLPQYSEDFLKTAKKVAKRGGIIHFYYFLDEGEMYDKALETIKKRIGDVEILEKRSCGQIAPRRYRVCIDFKLKN